MIRRLIFTLSLIFLSEVLVCQNIRVVSFRKLENDMSARVDAVKRDQNGDVCAIIKVVTTQSNFSFEGDGLGIVSAEQKVGEYWIYLPYGSKRLSIMHPQLGLLRDYIYPSPIERATVYELLITTGKVEIVVTEDDPGQFLVIIPEPADAIIFINDESVKSGEYQAKLNPGKYNYRVEAPLYHTEFGVVEIKDQKVDLKVHLKPAYGFLEVNTLPESDARIVIEGSNNIYFSPFKSSKMASGEYNIKVYKDMYKITSHKIVINDNENTVINVTMPPNYANVTVKAPSEAKILINNELKGKGTWQGRLNPALYTFSSSLDSHRDAIQHIELFAGEVKTIHLSPTPIFGNLDILTSPIGATVFINNKNYGNSPLTVKDLLIGEYDIQLVKQGYDIVKKRVSISSGNKNVINEKMNFSRSISTIQEQKPVEILIAENSSSNYSSKEIISAKVGNNFNLEKKLKKHTSMQFVWGLSTIISAGTGLYTMLKAEKLYNEYQNESFGSQIELVDKIETLDKIAPVAFGIAGFCSLNYFIQSVKKSIVKKNLKLKAAYIENSFGMMLTMNF